MNTSPGYRHRDMFDMELYYKSIGDEYASWLIEQFKEKEEKIQTLENDIESIMTIATELSECIESNENDMSEIIDKIKEHEPD